MRRTIKRIFQVTVQYACYFLLYLSILIVHNMEFYLFLYFLNQWIQANYHWCRVFLLTWPLVPESTNLFQPKNTTKLFLEKCSKNSDLHICGSVEFGLGEVWQAVNSYNIYAHCPSSWSPYLQELVFIFLSLRIKFHKTPFWVPIWVAEGPYFYALSGIGLVSSSARVAELQTPANKDRTPDTWVQYN